MSQEPEPPERYADLVLAGGGVKGLALVGAVSELARSGYRFRRLAGTSAGAAVAAVVAALERAGEPTHRLEEIARSLDYRRLRDRGPLARVAARVGLAPVVDGLALAFESGVFEGNYLTRWLRRVLTDLGVRTFGDLRLPVDEGDALPPAHRFRLVVLASDVSRQRLVRLPWDYGDYGLDPDGQDVAAAVHASAAIPFFFEPVTLRGAAAYGTSTLVDGGLLSNFPITIFDRTDGRPSRWPTFGIRLSARERATGPAEPVTGPISLAQGVLETLLQAYDAELMSQPRNAARSIFVDTSWLSALDFEVTAEERDRLLAAGADAAAEFLRRWDFARWRRENRGGPR